MVNYEVIERIESEWRARYDALREALDDQKQANAILLMFVQKVAGVTQETIEYDPMNTLAWLRLAEVAGLHQDRVGLVRQGRMEDVDGHEKGRR